LTGKTVENMTLVKGSKVRGERLVRMTKAHRGVEGGNGRKGKRMN